uniref:Peptidylamidoglycolate lyase n=1 Tax=Glossina brevipalpis TaxID=37001 RepID=A0A1A9WJX8_9MUSC
MSRTLSANSNIIVSRATYKTKKRQEHIFRAHVWTQDTFDLRNSYRDVECNNTVLVLDRQAGKLVYEWGKDLFYMPHGLSIDQEDNVWFADVALHQIFKFGPLGFPNKPLMTLDMGFIPGM